MIDGMTNMLVSIVAMGLFAIVLFALSRIARKD